MWTTKVTSDQRVPNSINCNTTGYRFFKEMYEKSNKNMLDDSHLPIVLFIKCGTRLLQQGRTLLGLSIFMWKKQ